MICGGNDREVAEVPKYFNVDCRLWDGNCPWRARGGPVLDPGFRLESAITISDPVT